MRRRSTVQQRTGPAVPVGTLIDFIAKRPDKYQGDLRRPSARRGTSFTVDVTQHQIPHIWNVDDEGHTPRTWASNLYHFVQRIFR